MEKGTKEEEDICLWRRDKWREKEMKMMINEKINDDLEKMRQMWNVQTQQCCLRLRPWMRMLVHTVFWMILWKVWRNSGYVGLVEPNNVG